ncbi:hypothetical protein TNCV_4097631 [Trichonephila clavipes]|nr:hypothetical protein TNCV_4097631 [Trichonephila clavipes]
MLLSSVVQLISGRMLLYQSTFISSQSLDSIKFNKSSKTSVSEESRPTPVATPQADGLAGALARALLERSKAIQATDESGSSSDEDDADDDWD